MCKTLITNRSGPWGTHTLRKTAYLFGVWGGGSEIDIMNAARHSQKTDTSAIYRQDAEFLRTLAEQRGLNPGLMVSKWKSIYCANLDLARSLGIHRQYDFFELSWDRFHQIGLLQESSVKEVVAAFIKNESEISSERRLNDLMAKIPDPALRAEIRDLIHIRAYEISRTIKIEPPSNEVECASDEDAASDDEGEVDDDADPTLIVKPVKPPKKKLKKNKQDEGRGGIKDFEGRETLKDLEGVNNKINSMKNMWKQWNEDIKKTAELREAARTFFQKTLKPVMFCIEHHYLWDTEKFCERNVEFAPSKYAQRVCKGNDKLKCGIQK